jgi:NAD(P)H dehydrogenase (quinone)
MAKIGIVYFSGYGHTAKLAEAVAAGASATRGAETKLFRIDENGDLPEGTLEELGVFDAIVYGSPTYMGNVAWQFKKFADATSKTWYVQAWKNKIAAGFTNSASVNGDKASTISWLMTFAMQHSQIWIGTGILPSNKKEHGPDNVNWTAGMSGLLAVSPSDASAEEAPRSGDLETARLFGARIAEYAVKTRG